MSGIFMNYRQDDGLVALLIEEALARRFGEQNVFREGDSLPHGMDFPPELWRRLVSSSLLLVVIGPHWLDADRGGIRRIDHSNDFTRREIEEALKRKIAIAPVLVDGARLPQASDLPATIAGLASHQYLHVRSRDAHSDLEALVEFVARYVPKEHPGSPDRGDITFETHGDQIVGDNHIYGRNPPPPGPEFPTDR